MCVSARYQNVNTHCSWLAQCDMYKQLQCSTQSAKQPHALASIQTMPLKSHLCPAGWCLCPASVCYGFGIVGTLILWNDTTSPYGIACRIFTRSFLTSLLILVCKGWKVAGVLYFCRVDTSSLTSQYCCPQSSVIHVLNSSSNRYHWKLSILTQWRCGRQYHVITSNFTTITMWASKCWAWHKWTTKAFVGCDNCNLHCTRWLDWLFVHGKQLHAASMQTCGVGQGTLWNCCQHIEV